MKNLTTPKYNFDQEIEFKYLEWMFERTKIFLIVIGLIAIGVIIFFVVRDSCNFENSKNMGSLYILRLLITILLILHLLT